MCSVVCTVCSVKERENFSTSHFHDAVPMFSGGVSVTVNVFQFCCSHCERRGGREMRKKGIVKMEPSVSMFSRASHTVFNHVIDSALQSFASSHGLIVNCSSWGTKQNTHTVSTTGMHFVLLLVVDAVVSDAPSPSPADPQGKYFHCFPIEAPVARVTPVRQTLPMMMMLLTRE